MPFSDWPKWLRWSNTRQAWQERLGTGGTVSAALLLWFFSGEAPLWLRVLGWAGLAMLLAIFSRRGWVKLFGPVLFYDLVRSGRRTRTFLVRTSYLGILLLVLCWMYLVWVPRGQVGEPLSRSQVAEFSLRFFITFMSVQMLLVTVLTPAYTAGAITEEKERKTLEFILATDLLNREIVFGKLLARMAHISLYILAGLPLLSALQFLGGFPPLTLLAGFACTGITMVSLACLSILASVLARRTRDALLLVYLVLIAYLVVSYLGYAFLGRGTWLTFPSTATWTSPVTVEDVIFAVQAGNPILVVMRLNAASGLNMDGIPAALGKYALFHGLLAVVSLSAAISLLRRAGLQEAAVSSRPVRASRWRPSIGDWPMIWKEVWLRQHGRWRWLLALAFLAFMMLSFIPPAFILYEYSQTPPSMGSRFYVDPWDQLGRNMNGWVRGIGMLVACLGLAGVGVRAATSIRGEHDRETMTSLLTSPLSSEEILFGKWLGSIVGMRWFAVWLGLMWFVAAVYNGLSPFMVPLLASAWLVYAGAMASLGLWFSVICKSSLRAILATLLTALLLGVGHWLPWMCCLPLMGGRVRGDFDVIFQMQGAITPPAVLSIYLSMSPHDLTRTTRDPSPQWLIFLGVCGTGCWGVFTSVLWRATNERFKRIGGRLDWTSRPPYIPTGADKSVPFQAGDCNQTDKLQVDRSDDRFTDDFDPPVNV